MQLYTRFGRECVYHGREFRVNWVDGALTDCRLSIATNLIQFQGWLADWLVCLAEMGRTLSGTLFRVLSIEHYFDYKLR